MSDTAKPDLKSQPRELVVSGKDIFIIDEIKLRGGCVCGMAQEKKNGQWKLSIHWPERVLFADEF
jgi:hypothetical protein